MDFKYYWALCPSLHKSFIFIWYNQNRYSCTNTPFVNPFQVLILWLHVFYSAVIPVSNAVLFVSYLQAYSYSDGQVYEKSMSNDDDEQYIPLWFVMDEFGSCIKHSDDPSFAVAIIHYVPLEVTFSVLWPLKDMDYGGLFLIKIVTLYLLLIWIFIWLVSMSRWASLICISWSYSCSWSHFKRQILKKCSYIKGFSG